MKNFKEFQDFLENASLAEKEAYFKTAPVLEQSLFQALEGDSASLKETALLDLKAYLEFIQRFIHEQTTSVLIFKDLNLFTFLLQARQTQLSSIYQELYQPSNQEIFTALSNLGVVWESDYQVANQQNLLHDSLKLYSDLFTVDFDAEDDEIVLLSSVLDFIKLELFLQDERIVARVKPKEEIKVTEKKQGWLDQISLIVTNINPEPVKYLGIALALGISLLASPDAQAGSKDAKDYLHKMDQALSKIEVPAGCKMGAKILAANGLGMTYEIQLGDYVIKSDFQKLGNISERSEQTAYKLKEQKGCGLSKADAIEMATKIDKNVMKLWAGIK